MPEDEEDETTAMAFEEDEVCEEDTSRTTAEETEESEIMGTDMLQEREITVMIAQGRFQDEEVVHLMQEQEDIHARRLPSHRVVGSSRALLLEGGPLA
jgi:hypothetical protein